MSETLQIGGLEFTVRRSDRRRTLGLTVDRGGELIAHAPAETSAGELACWLETKLLWVHRKLALKQETAPKVHAPEYVTGEAFCYLGRRYWLKVVNNQQAPLHFDGASFTLRRDAGPAESHFRSWYIARGAEWMANRVAMLSSRTATRPQRVAVRDLGFRWGSCGKGDVLYFNWKVLQLPVRFVDYIVVHELVHLREKQHGPKFYAALGRALPDWKERKESLAGRAKEYLVFGVVECGAVERSTVG
jgi:predicted metal-dependent hydrolase